VRRERGQERQEMRDGRQDSEDRRCETVIGDAENWRWTMVDGRREKGGVERRNKEKEDERKGK
jgi:hypothetical protein